jgi:hypothetical protein
MPTTGLPAVVALLPSPVRDLPLLGWLLEGIAGLAVIAAFIAAPTFLALLAWHRWPARRHAPLPWYGLSTAVVVLFLLWLLFASVRAITSALTGLLS